MFTDEDLPSSAASAEKAREKAKDKGKGEASPGPAEYAAAAAEEAAARAEAIARAEADRHTEAERQAQAQSEAEWRQRIGDARSMLKSAEQAVVRLEEESKRIAGEILLSTDTNQILALQEKRRKVEADLEAARAALVSARQAVADVEEDARRKGIPRHWLREP